jgi:Na+/H+-translocating membrane pyrophosphatase
MGGEKGVMTLIGREETHGRRFPGILEKIGLLVSILATIMLGQWMWSDSNLPEIALWPVTVCGLPIIALLLGEILARIIQRIHINSE